MPPTEPITVPEVFVFVLVAVGYFPVLRAYVREPESKWLLAAYTALLIGQFLSVLESFFGWLNLVEHVIGVALAGVFLAMHSRKRYREVTGTESDDGGAAERQRVEEPR